MLDLSYFQTQNSNAQGFFNGGTWQTWIKPRGAKLVNIICVGSGAGGGGGFQSASAPRGGGGAAGTAAISRLTISANLLPDILYILPGIGGIGGLGGTTATAGSSGQNSFICVIPDTSSASNVLLRSGSVPAVGGNPGTTTGGLAGAAETVNVISNNIFATLGTFTFQAGSGGGGGGVAGVGSNGAAANFIVGGAGGGGSTNGGASSPTGVFPGTASSVALVNQNGANGPIFYKPTLILYGGGGGGGSITGNGGNGGNGAPGAGGGGGGASTNTGINAGNGGKGGDGFVIITTSL